MTVDSARRLAWLRNTGPAVLVLDQIIFSLANMGLVLVAARSMSVDAFGFVAIGVTITSLAVGGARAAVGHVLVIERCGRITSAALKLVAIGAGSSCVAVLMVAVGFRAAPRSVLFALAVFALMAPIADVLRYLRLARGEYLHLVTLDLTFLGSVAAGAFWGATMMDPGVAPILAFVLAAVNFLVFVFASRGLVNSTVESGMRTWLTARSGQAAFFLREFAVQSVSVQSTVLLVPLIAGIESAGALKGVQTLFALPATFLASLSTVSLSVFSRSDSPGASTRLAYLMVFGFVAVVIGYTLAISVLPGAWGEVVLGPSFHHSRRLSWSYSLFIMGSALLLVLTNLLKASRRGRESYSIKRAVAPAGAVGFLAASAVSVNSGLLVLGAAYLLGGAWSALLLKRLPAAI